MTTYDAVAKATKSYQQHARDWKFLGYREALAIAVLTEFFSMGKVRNPSPKPLNVLAMVGKSRIRQLRDALDEQTRISAKQTENDAAEGSGVPESDDEPSEGG